jgi:hypothetical protein
VSALTKMIDAFSATLLGLRLLISWLSHDYEP